MLGIRESVGVLCRNSIAPAQGRSRTTSGWLPAVVAQETAETLPASDLSNPVRCQGFLGKDMQLPRPLAGEDLAEERSSDRAGRDRPAQSRRTKSSTWTEIAPRSARSLVRWIVVLSAILPSPNRIRKMSDIRMLRLLHPPTRLNQAQLSPIPSKMIVDIRLGEGNMAPDPAMLTGLSVRLGYRE